MEKTKVFFQSKFFLWIFFFLSCYNNSLRSTVLFSFKPSARSVGQQRRSDYFDKKFIRIFSLARYGTGVYDLGIENRQKENKILKRHCWRSLVSFIPSLLYFLIHRSFPSQVLKKKVASAFLLFIALKNLINYL